MTTVWKGKVSNSQLQIQFNMLQQIAWQIDLHIVLILWPQIMNSKLSNADDSSSWKAWYVRIHLWMANAKRFLALSLKWWQKLQFKWRRGKNLTLDRLAAMTFPNPASPTLCHKIYFTVIHLGWARRDCQTQLDTSSNHPTFETSKQPAPWEASTCRIMWYKEFHSK